MMDRRALLGLSALGLAALPLRASADAPADATPETIALWPSSPPGSEGIALAPDTIERSAAPGAFHDRIVAGIANPSLMVFRPNRPDGSAVLIAPGGGYSFEAVDLEGIEPARRFAAAGVTAFVLQYRLPDEGWKNRAEVPLQDAQRAMRLIRAHGPRDYGIDPARVGMLGFSAGGHLTALLATRFANESYLPVDAIDSFDARPSFTALLYPVVTMLPPFAHEASCEKLLGIAATTALREHYSPQRAVIADTPPCFLCAAADDPDVPVDNTLSMFAALRSAGIPAEMHIFEKGGHGFALRAAAGLPASAWPDLFLTWSSSRGYFRNAQP